MRIRLGKNVTDHWPNNERTDKAILGVCLYLSVFVFCVFVCVCVCVCVCLCMCMWQNKPIHSLESTSVMSSGHMRVLPNVGTTINSVALIGSSSWSSIFPLLPMDPGWTSERASTLPTQLRCPSNCVTFWQLSSMVPTFVLSSYVCSH